MTQIFDIIYNDHMYAMRGCYHDIIKYSLEMKAYYIMIV